MFPAACVRIVQAGKGIPQLWSFENSLAHLTGKDRDWQEKLQKETKFMCVLLAASQRLSSHLPCEYAPERFFKVQTAPSRALFAAKDLKVHPKDVSDRILLVPVSPKLRWVKPEELAQGYVLTTVTHTTAEHVELTLAVCPFSRLADEDGQRPFVHPAWFGKWVTTKDGKTKPNMEIQMVPASVFSEVKFPSDLLPSRVSRPEEVQVPVWVLTQDVQQDDELIFFVEPRHKPVEEGRLLVRA